MSRREIVVNTLLGGFLLMAAALMFSAFVAVGWLVILVLKRVAEYVSPGVALPRDLLLFAGFGTVSLIGGVRSLRHRQWSGAFLSFAAIPAMLSIWFSTIPSVLGRETFGIFCLYPILALPSDLIPTRSQFLAGAAEVCAVVAVNTGLLGSGSIARMVATCALVGVFLWFVSNVRNNWEAKNPGPQTPLFPTRA
jgi:hypothetical protein